MVLFILLVCISGTLFAHADKYSSLDEIKRAGNIDAIQSLVYEEEREKAGIKAYC